MNGLTRLGYIVEPICQRDLHVRHMALYGGHSSYGYFSLHCFYAWLYLVEFLTKGGHSQYLALRRSRLEETVLERRPEH